MTKTLRKIVPIHFIVLKYSYEKNQKIIHQHNIFFFMNSSKNLDEQLLDIKTKNNDILRILVILL